MDTFPYYVGICIVKPQSTFHCRGNHVLKGVTIKGKNMLPIGSIFFPLRVAPMTAPMKIEKKL